MAHRVEHLSDDVTLHCGDSLEILPALKGAGSIITDPPYGVGFKYHGYTDSIKNYGKIIEAISGARCALLNYPEEMMRHVLPVLGPPDRVFAWVYPSNLPRQTRLWGFWGCDVDPSRSKCKARNPESAKVASLYVAGYDWREIPQVKNVSAEKTEHPCQLPLGVARWVVETISDSVVIDPFMGSGTTGVAAVQLGRKCIGIEIEPKYFDIACRRISDELARPRLALDEPAPAPKQEAMF